MHLGSIVRPLRAKRAYEYLFGQRNIYAYHPGWKVLNMSIGAVPLLPPSVMDYLLGLNYQMAKSATLRGMDSWFGYIRHQGTTWNNQKKRYVLLSSPVGSRMVSSLSGDISSSGSLADNVRDQWGQNLFKILRHYSLTDR